MNKKLTFGILILAVLAVASVGIVTLPDTSATGNAVCVDDGCGIEKVKEFILESFTEIIDGKYYPQYSVKEITVNKGDLVRIKITVTSGMHDFRIDELKVYADTLLNKETIVEFVADKAGEFTYYCTKPGHRQNGQWGILKVIE